MNTFLHVTKKIKQAIGLTLLGLFFQQTISAQSLSFASPVLESGNAFQIGAQYRFTDVAVNVDALVTIEDLVNGAEVRQMDHTEGAGFDSAFQPSIYTPGGTSYAVFSIIFLQKGTKFPVNIADFAATIIDLDGNSNLKEFSEITISGGNSTVKYTTTSAHINVTPVAGGYAGTNKSSVEINGIDTVTKDAMYTVKRLNVSGFSLKLGAIIAFGGSSQVRHHSLFLKDFNYNNLSNNLSTLPVKLYSFSANLNNNTVDLKWVTASEINVNRFIVEKSTDGVNFSDAGVVFANGNATDKTNYSLTDNINSSLTGVIYYRIRSVDIDGKNEFSETRIIRISKQKEETVSIVTYPNPVSNEVRITIPANWQNKKVVYEVYAANGRMIKRSETASSSQTETMNVSSLSAGFYIVRVSFEGQTAQQKIVKQ